MSGNKEIEAKPLEDKQIPVYNYVNGPQNPLTWRKFLLKKNIANFSLEFPGEYIEYARKHGLQIPSPHIVWYSCFKMRPNRLWHTICVYLLHFLPAYLIDGIAAMLGRKPVLVLQYSKSHFC